MSATLKNCRVTILVKALPQPSKRYGETVCCAGVTPAGQWKRLFPIRFRHLAGDSSFVRWNWVQFQYKRPTTDVRAESCHVFEDSIRIDGKLARKQEQVRLLTPLILASAKEAALKGQSLALIRPRNTRFITKAKSKTDIEDEREAYRRAARQTSLFDKELAELEPSPYEFRFRFEDADGKHDYANGDWETHAMFWRESRRKDANEALRWMASTFNEEYPRKGMVFAIGNQAKRPQTWQLLGVLRLDESAQGELRI
ncbi:MAG TPA: hypothetical protein VFZ16_04235 [Hyphomicrobiaceae bacterium]|nr:hypothetical protein [Hyphomicrobiaceae bacterium]